MDWNTIAISAIPTLGTIVTIISTTILQYQTSKKETERLKLQLQNQQESEKSKAEEARKAAAFAKDLEMQYEQRRKITEYYTQMVEICCSGYNEVDQSEFCLSLYVIALKLLEYSNLSNELNVDVEVLIDNLEDMLFYNTALGPGAIDVLRPMVGSIGRDISSLPSIYETSQNSAHTETLNT